MCCYVTKTIMPISFSRALSESCAWEYVDKSFRVSLRAVRKSRLWFTILLIHLRVIITVNICLVACWVITLSMAVYWPYFSLLCSLSVIPSRDSKTPNEVEEAHWRGPSKLVWFCSSSNQVKSFPAKPNMWEFFFRMGTVVGPAAAHWLSVCRTIG